MTKHQLENLVVLSFSSPITTEATKAQDYSERNPETFEVNVDKGTWECSFRQSTWKDMPIGQPRPQGVTCQIVTGVIGVYDVSNIVHVNKMISDAIKYTGLEEDW